MDLPSHFIWAFVLFHNQPWAWVAVAFCCIPDVLWFLPRLIRVAYHRLFIRRGRLPFTDISDVQTRHLYRLNHSLITATFASLFAFLVSTPQMAIGVFAGWALHLFMDIWTHKGGIVDGIRLFYPLSDWKFPALIWWKEELERRPWVYGTNLAAAAIAFVLFG